MPDQQMLQAAIECCRGLLKTSVLIRKATSRDRFQKAMQKIGDPYLEQFDVAHVWEKYPKLRKPELQWLLERLGRAITARRHFLRYCREHQEKLEGNDSATRVSNQPGTLSAEHQPGQALRTRGEMPLAYYEASNSGLTELKPETKASTLNPGLLDVIKDEMEDDSASYTTAGHSDFAQVDRVLELPKLQTLLKRDTGFECPFCHTIQTIKSERQWRAHALSDLKSFVCTMESAECNMKLFGNSQAWLEHELQNHRCYWSCALCQGRSYRSDIHFREHLETSHSNLSKAEAELLDQASRRMPEKIPATDCPFCDEWEKKIREDLEEGHPPRISTEDLLSTVIVVDHSQFRRHVAAHMEQLALFAIPRALGIDSSMVDSNSSFIGDMKRPSRSDQHSSLQEADEEWFPDPPLHIAAFQGNRKKVEDLLVHGADVEAIGETWGTLLSAAEAGGHREVIEWVKFILINEDDVIPVPSILPAHPAGRLGISITATLMITSILKITPYHVLYRALDSATSQEYAVKYFNKFRRDGTPLDGRRMAFVNREIRLHYAVSEHPNILTMFKIIDCPDCIYLVLEYCSESDLVYQITEQGRFVRDDSLCQKVFGQLLDAVEFCHTKGIYHRDLKTENISVVNAGTTVKLGGFGFAIDSERSDDFGCGSRFYMSPECFDSSGGNPDYLCAPNDVWALGVVLINLTCGRNPWKEASFADSTYRAFTRDPDFLMSILPISRELNDILVRVFTRNPETRITLPELRSRLLACERLTVKPEPREQVQNEAVQSTTEATPAADEE
ncbi:kinase-like domain-containing protein [Cladorrhinum sp. PSN259]|nr:kinase-like domain-containing protein [Cladorrhinum sp. PSN259]